MFTQMFAFFAVGINQTHDSEPNHYAGRAKFHPEAALNDLKKN